MSDHDETVRFVAFYIDIYMQRKIFIESKLKSDAHVEACYTLNAHFCSISILSSFLHLVSFILFIFAWSCLNEKQIYLLSTGLKFWNIKAHFLGLLTLTNAQEVP